MNVRWKTVVSDLKALGNAEQKAVLSRFFKSGKGQYGFGDRFLGTHAEYDKIDVQTVEIGDVL